MDPNALLDSLTRWGGPALAVLVVGVVAGWIALRAIPDRSTTRIFRQLAIVSLVLTANVAVVLVLPLESETRSQLLSLFGLVLTAIVALSSTTFVANAMAGLMLRIVGGFHPGDFISVADHFGRVTEQGLLHTEVQSEDRDLVTLPNLFIISHPVKVVSATGTLVSVDVSLGYDVHRRQVGDLLKAAAEEAGLAEPFVQIKGLLDHAVAYRVSGFLEDVGSLISKRTELHARVLDSLHQGGVEIVSPSYMNQRRLAAELQVLPVPIAEPIADAADQDAGQAEKIMFDKAELAGRLTSLRQQRDELLEEIAALDGGDDAARAELSWRKRQVSTLDTAIAALQDT